MPDRATMQETPDRKLWLAESINYFARTDLGDMWNTVFPCWVKESWLRCAIGDRSVDLLIEKHKLVEHLELEL